MSEIRIEKGGRLTLPPGAAKILEAQPLRLSSCSANHLLLESAVDDDKVLGVVSSGDLSHRLVEH